MARLTGKRVLVTQADDYMGPITWKSSQSRGRRLLPIQAI